jgi:hypothetical protein
MIPVAGSPRSAVGSDHLMRFACHIGSVPRVQPASFAAKGIVA